MKMGHLQSSKMLRKECKKKLRGKLFRFLDHFRNMYSCQKADGITSTTWNHICMFQIGYWFSLIHHDIFGLCLNALTYSRGLEPLTFIRFKVFVSQINSERWTLVPASLYFHDRNVDVFGLISIFENLFRVHKIRCVSLRFSCNAR